MERSNRIIADRYLTPEQKENFIKWLEEWRALGKQPINGTLAKKMHIDWREQELLSDEKYGQIEELPHPKCFQPIIDRYNRHMKKRFDSLKIKTDNNQFIDPQQVHIVYPYTVLFPFAPKHQFGVYVSCYDAIYLKNINRKTYNLSVGAKNLFLAYYLIHESFHKNAFQRLQIVDNAFVLGRNGYHSSRFTMFNEAIIEHLTLNFLLDNQNHFAPLFSMSDNDFVKQVEFNYNSLNHEGRPSAKILHYILNAVATQRYIWEKLEEGFFTGDASHLKWIEQAFGRQSLRLLASIPRDDVQAQEDFLNYLKTGNLALKEKLIKQYIKP